MEQKLPLAKTPENSALTDLERIENPNLLLSYHEILRIIQTHIIEKYGTDSFEYDRALDSRNHPPYPKKLGDEKFMYEILNVEYVDRLADYISKRADSMRTDSGPVQVLEVGAGLGRLTHFLRQATLEKGNTGIEFVATDIGDYGRAMGSANILSKVEIADYQNALKQRQPQIVISSWMPNNQDWTPDFRAAPSVQEYILIGQPIICGKPSSWGESDGQVIDGFQRVDLTDLARWQIGFRDDLFPYDAVGRTPAYNTHKSRTVSFRRVA